MRDQQITDYVVIGSLSLAIFALPYSLIFCHIGLALFLISCAAEGKWYGKADQLFRNPIIILFVFFFLLHLVAIAYSNDQANGWFNVEKKISLIVIPLAMASRPIMKKASLRWLLSVFILSCFIATLICLGTAIYQYPGASEVFSFKSVSAHDFYLPRDAMAGNPWMFFSYDQLASGIHLHPTYLSLYLAFCAMILINFHAGSFHLYALPKKVLLLLLFAYFGLFVILLSSRIITLAYLGITFWGAYFVICKSHRTVLTWAYSFVPVGVLCFLIYLFPISRYRIIEEVASTPISFHKPGLQTQSTGIHASLWWLGLKSINEINPIWGTGPGDVQSVMKATGEKNDIRNVIGTNDPHNQYLQTMLGLGILGLVTLILCFAVPAVIAWSQKDFFYLGFIVLFAATCMVESALELQKGIVFFAIFDSLLIFQQDNFQISSIKIARNG